jgi:hypothetical protein
MPSGNPGQSSKNQNVLESVIEQQKVSEFLIFASRKKTVARNLQMCMTLKPPTL